MAAMIVERSLNEQFLSNTYLVADGEGGLGFFVDAGGPVAPLVDAAKRLQIEPTHVLLTHHHFDHVSEVGALRKRWPKLEVLIDPLERESLAGMGDVLGKGAKLGTIEAGEVLQFGRLEVRPLKTPGHTAGMLSFLVSSRAGRAAAPGCGRRAGRLSGGRRGGVHGRHAVQGQRGGREGAGPHHLYRPEGLDHGHADGAAGGDDRVSGSHRRDERREGVGAQPVHPRVAGARRGRLGAMHRAG